MLSAVILSRHSYSALQLALQQIHQRSVHPGPLVLRIALFNFRRADIEVPNTTVYVNYWVVSACYPQGNFYPLSDDHSILNRLITKPYFRICSTCWSRSQAPLYLYALRMISKHSEGTFGRLRYFLGGDRPSQTAHQTLSLIQIMDLG